MKKRTLWFFVLHAGILLLLPLAFLYLWLVELLPGRMSGCLLHDFAFLYCPLCGGTRAVEAMLSFDFLSALRFNAAVTLALPVFLVLDGLAWWRFSKGKDPFFKLPRVCWVLFCVALILFFIGRNYLMIVHGIDPTGDLGGLWRIIRETY
ncbi:MAG: DUF2752 domain-containing protein [Ruminococcaceae bacterium]|nr:DUF2752 domain-containing protein [Oscillospiraceae bacterium]